MGILSLLRQRKQERTRTASEFIAEAVQLVAAGDDKGIDVGKLETQLAAAGWTDGDFEAAVSRQQEISRLKAIVATEETARAKAKEASAKASEAEAKRDRIRKELDAEVNRTDAARQTAGRALQSIESAKADLRRLLDSPEARSERSELKGAASHLRNRLGTLREQLQDARSQLTAASESKRFDRPEKLAAAQAAARADIERLTAEIVETERQIAMADESLKAAESDLVGTH